MRTSLGTDGRAALALANAVALAAFTWPFLFPALVRGDAHEGDAYWVLAALLACMGAIVASRLGGSGMGPKTVALLGVLGAAMVALRLPGFIGGFSAMFVVVLLAGNAFGRAFGFTLGALGTLASAFFVGGLGPWVPFQMAAVGWVGFGAGLVYRGPRWPLRIGSLALFGAVAGYLFGALMNLWFWPFAGGSSGVGWVPALGPGENLRRYLTFYTVTSFGWDTLRAGGNALLVLALGRAVLPALDRAARRMDVTVTGVTDNGGGSRPGGRGPSSEAVEESPDSIGQDAGENPRRGDPRKVQQRADRRPEGRPSGR